ncbi:antibiotic biosynthesis monooxygenase family protein [Brucella pseudintermedia]|uniref:antibiotic biosynthesis monooxygenase family protein n=1 Tax=Brucella pseudintermedia TaxID=370111 RepID=UPI00124D38F9|nr:antibiotic biosynthesis monooxygenase family protein [Brucella pseudintermedia]KAB2680886.1 antibiotic biosynthesis monooxygenase [Brucella pseudintermedia]
MAEKTTAMIDPQAERLTLINVYEVDPEKQAELTKALTEVTESTIRHQPGFISVSIHSSFDGQKVVNYAQWASKEHFEGFMRRPETQDQLKRFAGLAKSVAPSLYRVNAVITE